MRVDLFDFDLPPDRIALRPLARREAARLLVVGEARQDRHIADLPDLLSPGDCLVVNDTRVIPARLFGQRRRGESTARIEALLHKRDAADPTGATWHAFLKPAKKVRAGETLHFGQDDAPLDAVCERTLGEGEAVLRFDRGEPALQAALEQSGTLPLPPYIAGRRAVDAADRSDYQTIFAREAGAVAAPTASLHFTPELVAALEARGVGFAHLLLHVGAGTFLPVKAEDTEDHRMHAEWGRIDAETAARLNAVRAAGRRIVAVGTTSLRLLESAATPEGQIRPFVGETDIFITPGYRFRATDALITNFHLPRSTLFMLVCAFSGIETMRAAYAHAIEAGYRFYSYGDACFLTRRDGAP